MTNNFLFGFCKNRTLNHKFPTECGRWQNMNLLMYSKSRLLCVFWRIVKARKVDRALHNVFCIVTLSIVIYVDNICIRWETDQKYSPKTLIGSVIVSVLANCLKRAETDIVLSVLDIRAYIVSFSASLDMNQVPEKLYLGQNLKQYVMKEAVIYKILRYRQNRCHTNEERWIDHSWHKAKIQHPQQCQSVFTVESQDNIPDCTNTHIKTALPISLPGVKETPT